MKKKIIFLILSKKKSGYKLIYNSAKLSGRGERFNKKKTQQTLYAQKGRTVWNTGKEK